MAELKRETQALVIPVLQEYKYEFIPDAFAGVLSQVFKNLRSRFRNLEGIAELVASDYVQSLDKANKKKFYSAMQNAVGVDVEKMIQSEGLEDLLVAKTRENVSLITSISDEYFKKLETIIFNKTTRKTTMGPLLEEISKLGKVTESRAKLIARDQTSKLNAAINQQRQTNLGIEEYIWRTSEDERVRPTHKAHNGKTFRWDSPPADTGHPGEDIQCRCTAQPIIKI